MPWVGVSIASLGLGVAVTCLLNLDTLPIDIATIAAPVLPSTFALGGTVIDDYQPPDNGGPGKSGGSGTRWQQA